MVLDRFGYRTPEEVKRLVLDYWNECEYLVKIRILLAAYPGFSITKIEEKKVEKLWQALSLDRQKDIYSEAHIYQI